MSAGRGICLTVAVALAAACGGGDGGSATSSTAAAATPPSPPPDTTAIDTGAATATTVGDDTAEQPALAFAVQVGGEASDTAFTVDADDDRIVVAFATEGPFGGEHAGGRDIVLMAYDHGGAELWRTQFGTEAGDSPLGVSIAPDGTIYAAGFSEGDLAGPNQGSADVWLGRFGPDGERLWVEQFGGPEWDRGFGVVATADGAFVSGYTMSALDPDTDRGGFDGFAAHYDADGEQRWVRQFGSDATDWGQGIAAAPDGGVYVTGYTEGDFGRLNAGDKDAFVVRLAADGAEVWVQQFGSPALDWTQGAATLPDGGVVVAGSTEGAVGGEHSGERDALLVGFGPTGAPLFLTQFGSDAIDLAFGVAVVGDAIIATGATTGTVGESAFGDRDAIIARLGADGSVVDVDQFGSDAFDDATGIVALGSGYVLVGYTYGDVHGANQGDADVLVIGRNE